MPEALAITRADHTMARSNARKRKPQGLASPESSLLPGHFCAHDRV
jgi:hypothetical protein